MYATGNRNAFVAPASIPAGDIAAKAPFVPSSQNFHAFSYKGDRPVINQRVINETATIVDYVNTQILAPLTASSVGGTGAF
ncbi:MAG: hypothetical protein WCI18_08560 [Pseudomonadota bacterium]